MDQMVTKNGWRVSWTRLLQDLDKATDLVIFRAERTGRTTAKRVDFSFANNTHTSGSGRSPRSFDVPLGGLIEATTDLNGPNSRWAWIMTENAKPVGFECPFQPTP